MKESNTDENFGSTPLNNCYSLSRKPVKQILNRSIENMKIIFKNNRLKLIRTAKN